MFLGLSDPYITGAMIVSILSMFGCIVYGLLNWNKGS